MELRTDVPNCGGSGEKKGLSISMQLGSRVAPDGAQKILWNRSPGLKCWASVCRMSTVTLAATL